MFSRAWETRRPPSSASSARSGRWVPQCVKDPEALVEELELRHPEGSYLDPKKMAATFLTLAEALRARRKGRAR